MIEGQGTVGLELLEGADDIDILFVPVGGGGLAPGVGSCFKPTRGVVYGGGHALKFFPARRATLVDPIEALKHE